jgi:hypothetical protein
MAKVCPLGVGAAAPAVWLGRPHTPQAGGRARSLQTSLAFGFLLFFKSAVGFIAEDCGGRIRATPTFGLAGASLKGYAIENPKPS